MVGLILTVPGCEGSKNTIEKRTIPQNNPTTYEFDASIENVKNAIQEVRGSNWEDVQKPYEGAEIAWKTNGNPFAVKIFSNPKNENDAFLFGMGAAVGKSPVYMKDGEDLTYYADFQIHITAVTPSRTRVEIFTYDSHVQAGTEWHPYAQAGIFLEVEPTSIEEYQILLDIGNRLGATDMPKLIMPDSGSPTQKVKETRRQ